MLPGCSQPLQGRAAGGGHAGLDLEVCEGAPKIPRAQFSSQKHPIPKG